LLGILVVLALASVYGNARWLGAQSYMRFSESRGQSPETREIARQASGLAHSLQPSSARALQAQAANDLFLGKTAPALDEYQAALLLAPADAYLWRDYALALIYAGISDERLNNAVIQAQTWALKSKPIHLSLAVAGLKVYGRSDEALRKLWMHSIRLAYAYAPDAVLLTAYVSEQELLLCDGGVIQKPETNVWCASARWRHGLCSAAGTGESGCFGKRAQ
jgi:hypothetical protein